MRIFGLEIRRASAVDRDAQVAGLAGKMMARLQGDLVVQNAAHAETVRALCTLLAELRERCRGCGRCDPMGPSEGA